MMQFEAFVSFCIRLFNLGALFHDYNDQRNIMPDVADYGVFQGVRDGLAPGQFEFYGVFGCAGLFRRTPQLTS